MHRRAVGTSPSPRTACSTRAAGLGGAYCGGSAADGVDDKGGEHSRRSAPRSCRAGATRYRPRVASPPQASDVRPPPGEGGDFDAALTRAREVDGWMTDGQARRLWDAARRLGHGAQVVEIGSYRGRSMIVLALAAPSASA